MSRARPPLPPHEPKAALDAPTIEAIADAIADRLSNHRTALPGKPLLTSAELAGHLGRTRSWVRDNAGELGVIRLGDGPRPRLLFDLEIVMRRMASCSADRGSTTPQDPMIKRTLRHRPRKAMGTSAELLPIRGSTSSENRSRTAHHKQQGGTDD